MKRREFIRELVSEGCYFERHGGRHDIYRNGDDGAASANSAPQRDQGIARALDPESAWSRPAGFVGSLS